MMPIDLKNNLVVSQSLAPSSRTASANGTALDAQQYVGNLLAVVDCGAATAGTNPTADFKIQDSADNASFADVSGYTFTQVTNAQSLQTLSIDKRVVRRYVRVVFTIGGTSSPAFQCSAHLIGQKQVK